jgi:hypothetical protein
MMMIAAKARVAQAPRDLKEVCILRLYYCLYHERSRYLLLNKLLLFQAMMMIAAKARVAQAPRDPKDPVVAKERAAQAPRDPVVAKERAAQAPRDPKDLMEKEKAAKAPRRTTTKTNLLRRLRYALKKDRPLFLLKNYIYLISFVSSGQPYHR